MGPGPAALGTALSTALNPASMGGVGHGEGVKFPEGAEGIFCAFPPTTVLPSSRSFSIARSETDLCL